MKFFLSGFAVVLVAVIIAAFLYQETDRLTIRSPVAVVNRPAVVGLGYSADDMVERGRHNGLVEPVPLAPLAPGLHIDQAEARPLTAPVGALVARWPVSAYSAEVRRVEDHGTVLYVLTGGGASFLVVVPGGGR